MTSADFFLVFGMIFGVVFDFVHIPCRDDTGRQSNDSNAENRGEHGDNSSNGGDRIYVAIAHCGQRNGRPINCIKKAVKGFRLHIINHQSGN